MFPFSRDFTVLPRKGSSPPPQLKNYFSVPFLSLRFFSPPFHFLLLIPVSFFHVRISSSEVIPLLPFPPRVLPGSRLLFFRFARLISSPPLFFINEVRFSGSFCVFPYNAAGSSLDEFLFPANRVFFRLRTLPSPTRNFR